MNTLLRLIGLGPKERPLPPTVPTDTVITVPYWDNLGVFRSIIPVLVFRFDDQLDAHKLHEALERLIARPGWQRLGGRLRKSPNSGRLALHIPAEFTEKRPAVVFSHDRLDVAISEHPLASRLPRHEPANGDEQPQPALYTVEGGLSELDPIMFRAGHPRKLDDYLYSDLPMLSLHVVSFTDGTLVSVAWQHVLSDAMGMKCLLDAWSLVLAGRDNEVMELAAEDPKDQLGLTPVPPSHLLARKRITGWRFTSWIARLLISGWFWKRQGKTRFLLCMPNWCIEKLRREAMANPPAALENAPTAKGSKHPANYNRAFVSQGDVYTAWCVALTALRSRASSTRTFTIGNVFSMRKRLPALFHTGRLAYIHNATLSTWTFLSVRDISQGHTSRRTVAKESVFAVAHALRRDIAEQTTPEFMEVHCAVERAARGIDGITGAQYGDASSMPIMMSNWDAAKFYDVDFSPAVIGRKQDATADQQRHTPMGKPSFFQGWMANDLPDVGFLSSLNILGVDAYGNHWLMAAIDGITSDAVRQALEVWTK